MKKNVFISGVSSGIGYGLAKLFLKEGYQVYGISRRSPNDLIENPNFIFRSIDLLDLKNISSSLAGMISPDLGFDLVILNAGILGPLKDLSQTSIHDMQDTMNVNLWSNKIIIDFFVSQKNKVTQVVSISSGVAVNAKRGWNSYSISKASLNMMTSLYARELSETHFTALAPGVIDTGMQLQISTDPNIPAFESFKWLQQMRLSGTMPHPEPFAVEIKRAIEKCLDYPSGSFLDLRTLRDDQESKNRSLIQRQANAYNNRDIESFAACYHPNVTAQYLSELKPRVEDHKTFKEMYRNFFESSPNLHCEIKSRIVCGAFVVDEENITGTPRFPNGMHAFAVYKIEDDLIRNIWFSM